MENLFKTLNAVSVNEHTEKKNGLTYLSWAWAWAELKKVDSNATYTIYENVAPNGWTINYFSDGVTCWVKVGVTANGLEHIEMLPVMDFKNKSIPLANVTSFDVNKAIQRALTKAIARHGLGLYIYAGEDLPEDDPDYKEPEAPRKKPVKKVVEKKEEPKVQQPNNAAFVQSQDEAYKQTLIDYAVNLINSGYQDFVNEYMNAHCATRLNDLSINEFNEMFDWIERG